MASTTKLRQSFEDLVKRAEGEVAANPRRYRWRLAALAALGYVVILGLLVTLLSILGGTIALALASSASLLLLFKSKLFVVLIVPIWVLARSLFVRIRAPDGYALERRDHPGLWREIDMLRSQLHALPIHRVIMTADMNAGVTQTPRLGIFGPYKNTLVLGLELLMSLSPEQARAVLAHEFGHLSGDHGRFGTWIYRKRRTWARIQEEFEEHAALGMGLMRRFIQWYVPRLAGYSFALARQQEYEADAVAASLTSRHAMASALVQCATREEITKEDFWKPLLRRALHEEAPEAQTYTRLLHHLKASSLNRGLVDGKIAEAMRQHTSYSDTHPALADRLAALDAEPALEPATQSAAEAWIGEALPRVLADFDAQWLEQNGAGWASRNEYGQAAFAQLKELSLKSRDELTQAEAWQLATLTEELTPEVDALEVFKAYRSRFPDDPDGDFVVGRILLVEHNDAAGIAHLERAAEQPQLRSPAFGIIAEHYKLNGRPDLHESWLLKAEAAYDVSQAASAERDRLLQSDSFKRPRLGDDELALVAEAVRASSVGRKISEIWIAEKVLEHYPEQPVYIVLVKPALLSWGKNEFGKKLGEEVPQSITLPHTWYFTPSTRGNRLLTRKVKAVGCKIG